MTDTIELTQPRLVLNPITKKFIRADGQLAKTLIKAGVITDENIKKQLTDEIEIVKLLKVQLTLKQKTKKIKLLPVGEPDDDDDDETILPLQIFE